MLKVRLTKICKIEPPDLLFLVVFISFYISRYHFSQIFKTSFRIIRKKDFRHKRIHSNTPSPTSDPLNSQILLSVMKVFCQYSLKPRYLSRITLQPAPSHFGMCVLLDICNIFSKHLFLRTPLTGCFILLLIY